MKNRRSSILYLGRTERMWLRDTARAKKPYGRMVAGIVWWDIGADRGWDDLKEFALSRDAKCPKQKAELLDMMVRLGYKHDHAERRVSQFDEHMRYKQRVRYNEVMALRRCEEALPDEGGVLPGVPQIRGDGACGFAERSGGRDLLSGGGPIGGENTGLNNGEDNEQDSRVCGEHR